MKKILAVVVLVMFGIIAVGYGYNKYQNQVTRVGVSTSLAKGAIPTCYNIKRNGERVVVSCESVGITVQ
jgi:hypothetical protein